MKVELVAGFSDEQWLVELELEQGATVWDAVLAAKIESRWPEFVPDPKRVGIFGRLCSPEQVLAPGDRVEVYRPLTADPKEVRRELAKIERKRKNSVV